MATTHAISLSEYERSSFEPDREYVDGDLIERHVGNRKHGLTQGELFALLREKGRKQGVRAIPEFRIKVSESRYRIPDIAVFLGSDVPQDGAPDPPFLCVEVLSPDDTFTQTQKRIMDFFEMGVQYVWVIDPESREAWVMTRSQVVAVRDGMLRTAAPEIEIALEEVLAF